MRISEIAKVTGVGVETIRFYERKGLIKQPARPANGGFRTYPTESVSRIRFVREAQELGFSLGEINELLSLKSDPGTDCSSIRERAALKRKEVDSKIKKLKALHKTLTALIDACPGKGAVTFCSILNTLGHSGIAGKNTKVGKPKEGRKTHGRKT